MIVITPAGVKPKQRSFRVTIGLLVGMSAALALITLLDPDLKWVVLLTMIAVFGLLFTLAIEVLIVGANRKKIQFSLRGILLVMACLALYLSLLREPWTFRLRFIVSRRALERLAAEVERGETPGPQLAGLFYIKKADRKERDGQACAVLWTEPDGDNPCGFVHPVPNNMRSLNDWSSALQNDPEWFYFIQD